jgi:hypothetical protein
MENKRPSFLGIGVTKAGTTWLWKQLNKHPDVWLAPEKEMHFFDRAEDYPTLDTLATASFLDRLSGSKQSDRRAILHGLTNIARSVIRGQGKAALWWGSWTFGHYDESWYVNLFSQARPDQACGEITPGYAILRYDDIVRIREINPNMRLILMIRDPIDRAWSGLRHNVAKGNFVDWNSERHILSWLQKPDVLLRGDFERIVDNYLAVFEPSQLLVGFYDAISKDPLGLMNSVTSHLGLKPLPGDTKKLAERVNVSPKIEMPDTVKDFLLDQYMPIIARASNRLGSYASYWEFRYSNGNVEDANMLDKVLKPAVHP